MIILSILIALVLAFVAFQFIKGIIKFAVLALVLVFGIFVAHQAGAF